MSVIKPDNVIPCTPNSWGASDNPRLSDRVYNDIIYPESNPWHPIVPEDGSKTWIIYKYSNPVPISEIRLSFYSGGQSTPMIVKIYKNVNTQYTETTKFFVKGNDRFETNYRTLTTYPSEENLIYRKDFSRDTNVNITDALSQEQTNISNVYIEFSYATFVYEIQLFNKEPMFQLKSEKGELRLKNFKPKNYCMFTPNIDNGEKPRSVDSIVLINNNIYFCVFEVDNSVKINVFTKGGTSLDHIFIPNLPDKSKLIQTILNGIGLQSLSYKPYTVYKYSYNYSDIKTKTQWSTLLSPYIMTSVNIKNLYENGDENIVLNKNTITYVNINTQFYVNYPSLETDRILVYQQGTNKLLHITDWIAKGTIQNVTINYTNNNGVLNITSSVIPSIKSSYASVGNIPYSGCDNNNKNNCKVVLKGYEWNREPFNTLKINNNSFCRAIGSTFRGGQSMYLGNVIDNKCRVREYYDIDGRGNYMGDRLSDKSDFEYLNLLNDSGIIWTNKNNVPLDSKRRVLVQINSWDPNNEVAYSICKVNDMIGQIEGDHCLLSNDPYNKRFTYNNFDVLYQSGKEP